MSTSTIQFQPSMHTPFFCPSCSHRNSFGSLHALEAHLCTVHFSCRPYICDLCRSVRFPTKHSLKRHYQDDHAVTKYKIRYEPTYEELYQIDQIAPMLKIAKERAAAAAVAATEREFEVTRCTVNVDLVAREVEKRRVIVKQEMMDEGYEAAPHLEERSDDLASGGESGGSSGGSTESPRLPTLVAEALPPPPQPTSVALKALSVKERIRREGLATIESPIAPRFKGPRHGHGTVRLVQSAFLPAAQKPAAGVRKAPGALRHQPDSNKATPKNSDARSDQLAERYRLHADLVSGTSGKKCQRTQSVNARRKGSLPSPWQKLALTSPRKSGGRAARKGVGVAASAKCGKIQCKVCRKFITYDARYLPNHVNKHLKLAVRKCLLCGYTSDVYSSQPMTMHMNHQHADVRATDRHHWMKTNEELLAQLREAVPEYFPRIERDSLVQAQQEREFSQELGLGSSSGLVMDDVFNDETDDGVGSDE